MEQHTILTEDSHNCREASVGILSNILLLRPSKLFGSSVRIISISDDLFGLNNPTLNRLVYKLTDIVDKIW
jgi:hypothetical protein